MLQLERRRNARRYCTYTVALDVTMTGSQFSPRRICCHVTMPTKEYDMKHDLLDQQVWDELYAALSNYDGLPDVTTMLNLHVSSQ